MRFALEVGNQERYRIEYFRSWFWGTERLHADGQIVASRQAWSLSNIWSFPLCRRYEFRVGAAEPHVVVFEKERPLLLAGFRPHTYRLFVGGQLVHERRGY